VNIEPNEGDIVNIRSFVYDTWYEDTGKITAMTWDRIHQANLITVNGHYYLLNGAEYLTILPPEGATCRLCGESSVEMTPVRVTQNYGEDGGEDDGGCFSESHTEWRCADTSACRNNRREWGKIMRSAAIAEDGALREAGFGAIGV